METTQSDKEVVKRYLDNHIEYWREQEKERQSYEGILECKSQVDALQVARLSILGNYKEQDSCPHEKEDKEKKVNQIH